MPLVELGGKGSRVGAGLIPGVLRPGERNTRSTRWQTPPADEPLETRDFRDGAGMSRGIRRGGDVCIQVNTYIYVRRKRETRRRVRRGGGGELHNVPRFPLETIGAAARGGAANAACSLGSTDAAASRSRILG